jgi:tRNA (cytidine/uridine-2'-O-)-methyltransferase
MDYLAHADWYRHESWSAFAAWRVETGRRLLLLTVQGPIPHHQFQYRQGDILLAGRESAGVPETIHAAADGRVRVPMQPNLRSINVAMATALVVGEALRQTGGLDRLS